MAEKMKETYPTNRTYELLEKLENAAEALVANAEELWGSVVPSLSPMEEIRYNWMKNPKMNDFVYVHMADRNESSINKVGIWIQTMFRPVMTQEEWGSDEAIPEEEHFLIETLDGREFPWHNVQLLRIPKDEAERRSITAEIYEEVFAK